jgi:hypothetical protein
VQRNAVFSTCSPIIALLVGFCVHDKSHFGRAEPAWAQFSKGWIRFGKGIGFFEELNSQDGQILIAEQLGSSCAFASHPSQAKISGLRSRCGRRWGRFADRFFPGFGPDLREMK